MILIIEDFAVGKSSLPTATLATSSIRTQRATIGVEFQTQSMLIDGKRSKLRLGRLPVKNDSVLLLPPITMDPEHSLSMTSLSSQPSRTLVLAR
ncbi:hypothetical protein Bca4012_026433 [Brassica carinata]